MARGGKRPNAGRKRVSDQAAGEKQSKESKGESGCGGGLLLADKSRARSDMAMLRRAVREGWDIPASIRQDAAVILEGIAREPTRTIMTEDGPVDVTNAPNQIAAIRTLAELSKENQTDFWNEDKNERLDAGKSTENVAYQPPPTYDLPLPATITRLLTGDN